LILLLSLAAPAFAAEPETEPAATPAAVAPDAPVAADAPSAVDAEDAKARRRARFELHRSIGYVSEALLLGSLVFFALDDHSRFGGGSGSKSFLVPEIALGGAAEVALIANYLLAATAPPRPGGTTVKNILHQSLMYASAAANIARLAIAIALSGASSASGNEGLVLAHRITAIASPLLYATAASLQFF